MTTQKIPLLIEELSSELELPSLKLEEEGSCILETESGIDVVLNFIDDEDMLVLYAEVGAVEGAGTETASPEKIEEIYAELLKANFGWLQTQGTTLGITDKNSQVVLQKYIRGDLLDVSRLVALIETFSVRAALCRDYLKNPTPAADLSTPETIDPTMLA